MDSLVETHTVAAALASVVRPGDLIVLSGEMGAGKTAFAKGFGAALGVDEPITSPTFTLVHTYELPRTAPAAALHHADLYRLDRTAEIADLALVELAEDDGIVLVEWGDVAESLFGDHLGVHLAADLDTDHDTDHDIDPGLEPGLEPGLDRNDGGARSGVEGRWIEVSATGPSWAGRWSRIVAACEAFAC